MPATTTIRQQIIDAVLARLRTINPLTEVNGDDDYYETDIGGQVFEWRDLSTMPLDADNDSECEALSVNDFEERGSQEITNAHEKELKFEVRFATNKGTDSISVAERCRSIIADIERCIGVDRMWTVSATRLARDTRNPERNEMAVEQKGRVVGFGRVIFAIRYRNVSFNPYSIQ